MWNQDQEKQTLKIAVEELTQVYLAASSEIDQQITELIAEKKEANQERIGRLEGLRDNLRTRVNKLNNRKRINNVLKMAESWLPTSTWNFVRNDPRLHTNEDQTVMIRDVSTKDDTMAPGILLYTEGLSEPAHKLLQSTFQKKLSQFRKLLLLE